MNLTEDNAVSSREFPRVAMWVLVAMFLGTSIAALSIWIRMKSSGDMPVYGSVPEFVFTAGSGEPFGREDLDNQVVVVSFFFTRCLLVCPAMNSNMSKLYVTFSDLDEVRFVSISVDPDHDTLETLREYSFKWGVTDQRWMFLRGAIDDVIDLSENGFTLAADGLPMGHSVKFSLVDQKGRIRGYYSGLDDKEMVFLERDIRRLLVAGS